MPTTKILITGGGGQLGTELGHALAKKYGKHNVISTDIREIAGVKGPFELLDVTDRDRIRELVQQYDVTQIYHLAAILSAAGEAKPELTWKVNMDGWLNVLEVAREAQLKKVYYPSSIAIFGPDTPKENTPQYAAYTPSTVYGMSKRTGEMWAKYYYDRYGLDVRSLRYPGIISYKTPPGGGTTDYAVDIFYKVVQEQPYECFLRDDTRLPMMYMPDAIRATLELMEAPADSLTVRTSYNLGAMDFTPTELVAAIRRHYAGQQVSYAPDFRQQIADSWVRSVDDTQARTDWGWQPEYDLDAMVDDMLLHLRERLGVAEVG